MDPLEYACNAFTSMICTVLWISLCTKYDSPVFGYCLAHAGGNFLVALELLSSSHVETRVSAIKLLSLMLVGEGVAQTGLVLQLSSFILCFRGSL